MGQLHLGVNTAIDVCTLTSPQDPNLHVRLEVYKGFRCSVFHWLLQDKKQGKKQGKHIRFSLPPQPFDLISFFPTLGVGLLDFKLNPSPRPELFSSPGLLLAHPFSAQPQSVPGVPNSTVFLECPTPEFFWSAQPQCFRQAHPQSLPASPWTAKLQSPRSAQPPECPAPESPWSAQPQTI